MRGGSNASRRTLRQHNNEIGRLIMYGDMAASAHHVTRLRVGKDGESPLSFSALCGQHVAV